MKKKLCCLFLTCLLALFAAGCGSFFAADYQYEEPVDDNFSALSKNATDMRNYSMLKTALTDMISRHEVKGEFQLKYYSGVPEVDLAAVCQEIRTNHPLGAYAVDKMTYTVNDYHIARVYIDYSRTAAELESIIYLSTQTELEEYLRSCLDAAQTHAVVRVYLSAVDENVIADVLQEHYYDEAVNLGIEPEITLEAYPSEGYNRIYDISIAYADAEDVRGMMAAETALRIDTIVNASGRKTLAHTTLALAEYLSENCTVGSGKYADTPYGALVEQKASSKGLALAFRALCSRMGISCRVVEGTIGTEQEPHYWNIVGLESSYYHVDVSVFSASPAAAFLRSDSALQGAYSWDTTRCPVCDGALSYYDLVPAQPEKANAAAEENLPADGESGAAETGSAEITEKNEETA